MKRRFGMAVLAIALGVAGIHSAFAWSWPAQAKPEAGTRSCMPEVGFSPEGSAELVVDRAIDSATHWIRLGAYSFTSADIVAHLIAARRRGVDVAVVVDERANVQEDRWGRARAALNLLVNAGIPVRTVSVYPIHHDKYMVIDGQTVETGSFNYSRAAAVSNSENALVLHDCPDMARAYAQHWESRWRQGQNWGSTY